MKTLNKFIFLFLLSFISIGVFSGSIVSAQNTASEPSIAVSEEDSSVYSGDVIVWKYKTMNGKLYKRKNNKKMDRELDSSLVSMKKKGNQTS